MTFELVLDSHNMKQHAKLSTSTVISFKRCRLHTHSTRWIAIRHCRISCTPDAWRS